MKAIMVSRSQRLKLRRGRRPVRRDPHHALRRHCRDDVRNALVHDALVVDQQHARLDTGQRLQRAGALGSACAAAAAASAAAVAATHPQLEPGKLLRRRRLAACRIAQDELCVSGAAAVSAQRHRPHPRPRHYPAARDSGQTCSCSTPARHPHKR